MTSALDQAKNFFDLAGLNSIRQQSNSTDKAEKKEALTVAAKQFEAIFMQMLLKSMRSAQDVLESDSPFNSQSTKFYRDMHDQQMAIELSSNGSLGLSELIVRQLGGDKDNFTPNTVIRGDGHLPHGLTSEQSKNTSPFELHKNNTGVSINRQSKTPFTEVFNLTKNEQRFTDSTDFVQKLTEPAKQVEKNVGIPFQVVIAQAALETGWGKKIISDEQGNSSNNLFNIKADKRWPGESIAKETLEFEQGTMVKKVAPFRAYQTLEESINDYSDFLSNSPRYQATLEKVGNVEHFLQGLQDAGYATDPKYAEKIMGTLKSVINLLQN